MQLFFYFVHNLPINLNHFQQWWPTGALRHTTCTLNFLKISYTVCCVRFFYNLLSRCAVVQKRLSTTDLQHSYYTISRNSVTNNSNFKLKYSSITFHHSVNSSISIWQDMKLLLLTAVLLFISASAVANLCPSCQSPPFSPASSNCRCLNGSPILGRYACGPACDAAGLCCLE